MVDTDPQIVVMTVLKDNWNQTTLPAGIDTIGYIKADGTCDEEVLLHTTFFNKDVNPMPQIAIENSRTIPTAYSGDTIERCFVSVMIWVPRIYGSNSLGTLINYRYRLEEEVKQILRSNLSSNNYLIEEAVPADRMDSLIEGYMATEIIAVLTHDS